jgi:hypothetical protein
MVTLRNEGMEQGIEEKERQEGMKTCYSMK